MRKIKYLILMLVVSGMFFALQANTGVAKVQADTIKIGALGPLAITPGKDMEAGAKLAVKEINAAGGVTVGATAYNLELIVETTSSTATGLPDAATAVTNVRKLIDNYDVAAMLGLFRTEVTIAVMAELDRPFLGVGSTAPIITPFFWRVGPSNGTQLTRSLIDLYYFAMATLGVQKITIVREDAAWSLAMTNAIQFYLHTALPGAYGTPPQNFTDDIAISEGAGYDSVAASLATVSDDVDALMTLFSGPAGKHITEAWAALDMPQFLAGINVEAQSSTYFEETEGAAYGEIDLETCPPDIEPTPKSKPFRDAYYAEYGEMPTYTAFASYDSVYVIKDAIERADSTDVADIQAALATTDYQGAAYKIKFTSEPGSQLGVAPNGTKVPIEGAPTNITVHDLYTNSTVGVVATEYIQGYFAQWQKGGVKKTIWTRLEETVATRNITTHIEWPIDHAEHGWEPELTTTPTLTPTVTPTASESESEPAGGFELQLVLFGLGNLAFIVYMRKRKRR